MGNVCLLAYLNLGDGALREVDLKQHLAVIHDGYHRCSAVDLCLLREVRKVYNHTVKRSADVHLLQIHLGVLIIQT